MLAGLHFSSNAICNTCVPSTSITSITLQSGIYDDLFCSDNPDKSTKDWDYDTRFYARFQNNLFAGNVDYSASNVSMMRIKRRKNNEHEWIRIHEIPIEQNSDFDFEVFDRYAQACQDYYYALIPMINSVEGNMSKSQIYSEFDSYFITDKSISYPIIIDTSLSLEIQKQTSIVNTMGSKYPFVISNSINNYKKGSLQFGLVPMIDCELYPEDGYEYRQQFEKWITNGEPKILKDWTGQIFMIQIIDTIPIDFSFWKLPSYTLNFVEVGDSSNEDDLYYNNFIDVNYNVGGS